MANYVNGIEYPEDYIFKVPGGINTDPSVFGYAEFTQVLDYKFYELENGIRFLSDKSVERAESLRVTNGTKRKPFYFLHIRKNSGISLQREMRKFFIGDQTFINPIIYVNDKDMLDSKFISGHFGNYPINLFSKNNIELNTVTIFRNPVDRVISQFAYEIYFKNWSTGKDHIASIDEFEKYLYDDLRMPLISNLQAKSITSTLDIDNLNRWTNRFMSNKIDIATIMNQIGISLFMQAEHQPKDWKNSLDKITLFGTMDNRENFLKSLTTLLEKEGYSGNFSNVFLNKGDSNVEVIKRGLTLEHKNRIMELNQYDIEIYEHALSLGI